MRKDGASVENGRITLRDVKTGSGLRKKTAATRAKNGQRSQRNEEDRAQRKKTGQRRQSAVMLGLPSASLDFPFGSIWAIDASLGIFRAPQKLLTHM